MTPIEATDLAVRISQTWPRGIPNHVWEEELTTLDRARASTTFVRLRRRLRNSPSIAEFLDEYSTVATTDGDPLRRHGDCKVCSNTGTVPRSPEAPDGREQLDGVKPCTCPFGEERKVSLAQIIRRNAAELDRVMPARHLVAAAAPGQPAAPDPLF